MSEIFISYARGTAHDAARIAEALRSLGYGVWHDDELPAHRDYSEVIEERLRAATAVVVVWSAEAAKSQWVRAEADLAREAGTLVQLTLDGALPPMPFNRIQCADMSGWTGDLNAASWKKVAASVAELVRRGAPATTTALAQTTPPVTAAPLQLPDKPSIAVLPFADPSGAVEGDYFADGMVDEIAGVLTRFSSLFVIASGSSLSYRERERDFRKIGSELGVRYCLEGSVRRSGGRVRIAVNLVEAETGEHIWYDRFDGTLDDVFALHDEVANAVAARIEPTIQAADLRRGAARPTEDLGAYDLFLRGQQRYREFDNVGYQAAIELWEQAVARDPTFSGAWAFLASLHTFNLIMGWTDDREGTAHKAQDAIRHVLLTNEDDAFALVQAAWTSAALGGDRRASLAMADRALSLNPGSSLCWTRAGWVSIFGEQYAQAIERLQHGLRLNPRAPDRYQALTGMGAALVIVGRPEEAVSWLEEAIALRPDFPTPLFTLAIALSQLGRVDEAKVALARFETLASLKSFIETAVATRGWSDLVVSALRRLGADV